MDMWIKGLTKHGENRLQLTDKKQSRYQILEKNYKVYEFMARYSPSRFAHPIRDAFPCYHKPFQNLWQE